MTYIQDLTQYNYNRQKSDAIAVGWLDIQHPFETGDVSADFINMLSLKKDTNITEFYMGSHTCQFCTNKHPYAGNGTVFVTYNNITYAAPEMILHYVVKHKYKPPQEFIDAVLNGK